MCSLQSNKETKLFSLSNTQNTKITYFDSVFNMY